MSGWDNFFVAGVGASATLAGLLFVGISLNLSKILEYPWLPGRALEALLLLLTVLVECSLMLVPGQPPWLRGAELLVVGLANWLTITHLHRQGWRAIEPPLRGQFVVRVVFSQAASVAFILGGIALTFEAYAGLYWLVPGVLLSFVVAVISSWVLLIEVNR